MYAVTYFCTHTNVCIGLRSYCIYPGLEHNGFISGFVKWAFWGKERLDQSPRQRQTLMSSSRMRNVVVPICGECAQVMDIKTISALGTWYRHHHRRTSNVSIASWVPTHKSSESLGTSLFSWEPIGITIRVYQPVMTLFFISSITRKYCASLLAGACCVTQLNSFYSRYYVIRSF